MCCIQILTAYDPQKALANLPKPLLTSDLFSIPLGAKVQRVELTAGLHRQTRINGSVIHVDIHVASRSSKTMKKIEIQLVKANPMVSISCCRYRWKRCEPFDCQGELPKSWYAVRPSRNGRLEGPIQTVTASVPATLVYIVIS